MGKEIIKVKEFDKFARNLKKVTFSNWNAWRYVIDFDDKHFTFVRAKEELKKRPKAKYIRVYFKDTYWDNLKLG